MKKTKKTLLKKNEHVTLQIEDIGVGGEGIGFLRIPVEEDDSQQIPVEASGVRHASIEKETETDNGQQISAEADDVRLVSMKKGIEADCGQQNPVEASGVRHASIEKDIETDNDQQIPAERRSFRFPVFVKDAVPGDTIEAVITKAARRYAYGHLNRILRPSPFRVTPPCPIAKTCGGCQIQAMDYAKQLEFKQRKVLESLIRIGGFTPDTIDTVMRPIVGMDNPWHFRNKEQVPVQQGKFGPVTGFFAAHSHTVVPMTDCLIGRPENRQILETILSWMQEHDIPAYDETTGRGLIRHILIRNGMYSGQIMVCVIANDYRLPFEKELLKALTGLSFEGTVEGSADASGVPQIACAGVRRGLRAALCSVDASVTPHIASISLNTNTERTNVITGRTTRTLWGSEDIEDTLYIHEVRQLPKETLFNRTDESVTFRISPLSFYQVNPRQTEKLYSLALACAGLTGNETVWDLYCGVGTISLFMARHAGRVYGVEVIPEAIENARQNAARNGIQNAEFYVGKAEEVLPAYVENLKKQGRDPQIDVICVDPPRKGCDEKCIETMLEIAPKRIVYVSCDPATLARDLKKLAEGGYELDYVQPADQFGHSVHVETVVCLSNKNAKPKDYVEIGVDAEDYYRIKNQKE